MDVRPVVPSVYETYKSYGRKGIPANPNKCFSFDDAKEAALFDEVYKVYGKFSAIGLMNMTHDEEPWKSTPTGEGNIIPQDKMRSFFKTRLKE